MQLLFLNGFDRCGSSMISGLLGRHPGVEAFFQPFNRTEVHRTQHEVWRSGESHPATEAFVAGLLEGRVEPGFLGADLFERHSTAPAPREGALNVVKETKLHFKAAWLKDRFPGVAVRGLWRDPRGILCSLLRNGFADDWYGERAFRAIAETIAVTPELACYRPFIEGSREGSLEDDERLALVVAARTHLFGAGLAPGEWIVYEEVLANADAVLGALVEDFGLQHFEFSAHLAHDFNVVGQPSRGADLWRTWFSPARRAKLDAIFAELEPVGPAARRLRASS